MITAAVGILLFYLAYFLGRRVTGISIHRAVPPEQESLAACLLGLGILGYAVLGLGLAGLLTPKALVIFFLLTSLGALLFLRLDAPILRDHFKELPWPRQFLDYAAAALAIVTLTAGLAGVLAPETANDSLCYHLNLPKIYLQSAAFKWVPFDTNSGFPLLLEMLYTLALALDSVPLAKLFHFATAILCALLIASAVTRWGKSKRAGIFAALLFLTAPLVVNQMGTTYVDVALAAFSFFSFILILIWAEQSDGKKSLLCGAGLFAGLALSVKFLALISIMASCLIILEVAVRKKKSTHLKDLLAFAVPAALCGGFWYVRSWIHTGNPVYPYFASVFGAGDATIQYDDIGVPKTILSFLTSFWTLTMKPQMFEGFGVQIGPGYLAFLPLGVAAALKNRTAARLLLYAIIFFSAWFMLGQSLRFLLPVLPVLAVLCGMGLALWTPGKPRTFLYALWTAVIALHALFAVYHYRREYAVALGQETTEEYLGKHERSFQMAAYAKAHLAPNAVILNADETHMFYFPQKMIRETVYVSMGERYWENAVSPEAVIKNLKKRGFTHILRACRKELVGKSFSDQPLRVFAILDRDQNQLASGLNRLYTYEFTDDEAVTFTYGLYEIL